VLDGLSDLDAGAQARLVRALDTLPEDAPRLISIADGNLAAMVAGGQFRQDLFYRLNGVTLNLPPLRERIEDIALLCDHFLARAARDTGTERRLSAAALEVLRRHNWPGNVRQLENTIRRLVVTASAPEISAAEIELPASGQPSPGQTGEGQPGESLSDAIARHIRRYFALHGDALPPPGLYGRILQEMESPLLDIALEHCSGNQARCADLLGINRNTLRKKITDLDIRVTRRRKLM
jgi:two-component system nitrogen regulation response regulator GlnG